MVRAFTFFAVLATASAFGTAGVHSQGAPYKLVEKDHVYMDGDIKLNGYLMYPEGADTAPANSYAGLLIMPYFMGAPALNDRDLGRGYAEKGMVVFVADYYGKNYQDSNKGHVMTALMEDYSQGIMGNRPQARRIASLALKELASLPFVDEDRIGGIGFCAGGTMLSELARAGGKMAVAISLHGQNGVGAGDDATFADYKVTHFATFFGRNDPLIPPADVDASMEWLDSATARGSTARWEAQIYGGAVHGFSNPMSDVLMNTIAEMGMAGAAAYDEHWSKTCLSRADQLFQEYGLLPSP